MFNFKTLDTLSTLTTYPSLVQQLIFLIFSFQFGIILIIKVVLQVLEVLGLLMLLLLRESVVSVFLKNLMDNYYDNVTDREIMDDIQTKVWFRNPHCYGRFNSYTLFVLLFSLPLFMDLF